jgi:hypothetical protein
VKAKLVPISARAFELLQAELYDVLLKKLEEEQAGDFIPDGDDAANTDIFDTPAVDSKTVVKLSGIVESMTGHTLKPDWIKKGGYSSIEEAALDVVNKIREHGYDAAPLQHVPAAKKAA